jgi:hypothetical protein
MLGSPIQLALPLLNGLTGFGDLYPMVSLKWHDGVHNWMTYATGDIPVGAYDSSRISNIGIGHGAIDGGGYTYLNPTTGHEFSGAGGFTYNFRNPDPGVQSGTDFHFEWGASQFSRSSCLSVSSDMLIGKFPTTRAGPRSLVASDLGCSASARRSAIFSRLGACRAI